MLGTGIWVSLVHSIDCGLNVLRQCPPPCRAGQLLELLDAGGSNDGAGYQGPPQSEPALAIT